MIKFHYTPAEFALAGLSVQHMALLENLLLAEQAEADDARAATTTQRKLIPELLTAVGAALANQPGH